MCGPVMVAAQGHEVVEPVRVLAEPAGKMVRVLGKVRAPSAVTEELALALGTDPKAAALDVVVGVTLAAPVRHRVQTAATLQPRATLRRSGSPEGHADTLTAADG